MDMTYCLGKCEEDVMDTLVEKLGEAGLTDVFVYSREGYLYLDFEPNTELKEELQHIIGKLNLKIQ